MKFISNTTEIVKREIFFQFKSKSVLSVFALVVVITIIHMNGLYNTVTNNYKMYLHTREMYIENGIDVIDALAEDNLSYMDQNSKITNNPIKEDYINLAIAIQNIEPLNAISNTFEYFIFVFGTLIFGIYAAYVSTYDFKYKTYKFVSSQYTQEEIIAGKIGSIICYMFLSIFIMVLLSYILSFPVKYFVSKEVPIRDFIVPELEYSNSLLLQAVFSISVLVLYIIIGFSIGFITKNMLPITLFLLLYTLLIPVLGAYDIKNIISYFAHKVFNFKSRFVIFQPTEISEILGVSIIIGIILILWMIMKIISSKRSKFN